MYLLPGCETTKPGVDPAISAAREVRLQAILAEDPGDYFIGRRYHVEPTRYWGYLRRPRNGWETAKLVMMNESKKLVPGSLLGREGGAENNGYRCTYLFPSGKEAPVETLIKGLHVKKTFA